ncbi:MAG: hypothetical protein HQL50_01435 [Magnetococcales bacterium]|nr:hypothetical protein [Magnetococcales bacterium]
MGIAGYWKEIEDLQQFRADNGVIINVYENKGIIQFQGPWDKAGEISKHFTCAGRKTPSLTVALGGALPDKTVRSEAEANRILRRDIRDAHADEALVFLILHERKENRSCLFGRGVAVKRVKGAAIHPRDKSCVVARKHLLDRGYCYEDAQRLLDKYRRLVPKYEQTCCDTIHAKGDVLNRSNLS